MDEKKQMIIEKLLEDDQNDENYIVIPIVGMGGIGKTTLAQYVYNDKQLEDRFDVQAWVHVSQAFDVKRITTAIFNAATKQTSDFSNLNEAQERLEQQLKGKKFLIFLDDIWNVRCEDLEELQRPFLNAAKGSRVIMTTRDEEIARLMIDETIESTIIHLGRLLDNDCWLLFLQYVNVDLELAEMRDDILKKCDGFPLAAKALAGLLKKTHKRQRNIILRSETWQDKSAVLRVLKLSFYHLPSHLKRMFAYCSTFPKGYSFEEKEVVLLWMAQGFLPEDQPEDEGHLCLSELVSRSLFEEKRFFYEERFIMHDLIHDLALWAADGLCDVIDTTGILQDLKRTRHVFLSSNATTLVNQLPVSSKLRTFYCLKAFKCIGDLEFVRRFKYLRTLCLTSYKMEVLPEYVGDLKHLRFFRLRFTNIKELPKSMSNLWNLQTLCLESKEQCEIHKLPNIRFLGKLRHLRIGYYFFPALEEMPLGIGELTNLQSLDWFVLADGRGERIRDLKNLNHLHGKLKISELESVLKVEDAKEAQLDKKDGLDELFLNWGYRRNAADDISKDDVLEQLKPHNFIKRLKLFGYRGLRFPTWLGNPGFSKMVDITLFQCQECEYLPPLGQLSSLENLSIDCMDGIKEIGADFNGELRCQDPSFPLLKRLQFSRMRCLKKWVHSPAHDRAFPCLQDLSIIECNSLEGELPTHLPSLRKLSISRCHSLEGVLTPHLPCLRGLKIITRSYKIISRRSAPRSFTRSEILVLRKYGKSTQ